MRGGFIRPRNIDQASGCRPQQHVAVTLVEDQAGFGNVLSGDVENHCRNRHEAAVPPGGDQLVAAQYLATRHAADIGPDEVDAPDGGIGIEERLGFGLAAGKYEGLRHDVLGCG